MPTERAELTVREGQEQEFLTAFREKGAPILRSVPGVSSVRFGLGVENPSKFLIIAEWDSMEAHAKFPEFERYNEFRAVFGEFTTGGAMEHFELE